MCRRTPFCADSLSFFALCPSLFLNGEDILLLLRWAESAVFAAVWVPSPRATGNRNTTVRRPGIDGLRILLRLRVDTNINCCVETIFNLAANQGNLHDWIVTTLLSHVEEGICGVGGNGLFVGVVRGGLLDLAKEVLLDVELANVRDSTALNSVVGEELSTVVNDSCVVSIMEW